MECVRNESQQEDPVALLASHNEAVEKAILQNAETNNQLKG